jgi:inactivated superfamily I helicase
MPDLTPEKLRELRADILKRNRGTTHWSGCEDEHRDCMILKLLAEVERLEEALADKPPPADAVLLAKANRMLHERCEALESEVERLAGLDNAGEA